MSIFLPIVQCLYAKKLLTKQKKKKIKNEILNALLTIRRGKKKVM